MHTYEAETICDDDKEDAIESGDDLLTDEEKLEKYKRYLKNDLDNKLKQIDYEEKANAIQKEFEEKNKEKIAIVKAHSRSTTLSLCSQHECTFLSKEEIEALKKRYKELEARQIEILDNCTSEDFLLVERALGQVNALIDEYGAIEKLKLVLVDRIKSNILRDGLGLACENFENSQLTFKRS
jgi:hypothetical protein